jgi:hypothetical protein
LFLLAGLSKSAVLRQVASDASAAASAAGDAANLVDDVRRDVLDNTPNTKWELQAFLVQP